MKLKKKIEDFRVRELLEWDVEGDSGPHRVYRVTKRKLTSLEAAAELAREAGVHPGAVAMAGLKDRQGVTIQHMSIERGPVVTVRRADLRIETLGRVQSEISSASSSGNAFQIVVRGLEGEELQALRSGLTEVRRDGFVNYFDDQRFGNLRHGQGWIVLDLMRGDTERALKTLLTAGSKGDDAHNEAFKRALRERWGEWRACRDLAGRFGAHHSVFEHLKADPQDFAGAFGHVATRLRLIHLYAFQSHLWNRAVAELVRELTPIDERIVLKGREGPLVFPSGPLGLPATFRLPGIRLEDVTERERGLLADVLATKRLAPADFEIRGVPGFAFKGEDRATVVHPMHLRVRPAEPDEENRGLRKVRVRFELPRGAYATLLVRRLLARALGERDERSESGAELEPRPAARRPGRPERPERPGHSGHSGRPERAGRPERPGAGRPERSRGAGPRGPERGREERDPRGGRGEPRREDGRGGNDRWKKTPR